MYSAHFIAWNVFEDLFVTKFVRSSIDRSDGQLIGSGRLPRLTLCKVKD